MVSNTKIEISLQINVILANNKTIVHINSLTVEEVPGFKYLRSSLEPYGQARDEIPVWAAASEVSDESSLESPLNQKITKQKYTDNTHNHKTQLCYTNARFSQ